MLKDCGEMLSGGRVLFRGQRLAVSGKESALEEEEVAAFCAARTVSDGSDITIG